MKLVKILAILSIGVCASALAQDSNESGFQPAWYGSLHLGKTKTSLTEGDQNFSYLSIGGSFGYRFSEMFAAEFLGTFATNGEQDKLVSEILDEKVWTNTDAFGLYLTAQNKGNIYGKVRAGLAQTSFTYSASGFEDDKGTATGLSYGIGAGFKHNGLNFEVEYLKLPEVDDPIFDDTSYDNSALFFAVGLDF